MTIISDHGPMPGRLSRGVLAPRGYTRWGDSDRRRTKRAIERDAATEIAADLAPDEIDLDAAPDDWATLAAAAIDAYTGCYCRRCLIHDDPGGCLTPDEYDDDIDRGPTETGDEPELVAGAPTWGVTFDPGELQWGFALNIALPARRPDRHGGNWTIDID